MSNLSFKCDNTGEEILYTKLIIESRNPLYIKTHGSLDEEDILTLSKYLNDVVKILKKKKKVKIKCKSNKKK
jgi:hypothetical protein